MLNALTIDVEDYFQVSAFERHVDRSQWDLYPLRVVENTRRVLDLLDEFHAKATFFTLGWVAKRCPDLVRDIAGRGHEIASHGYGHELVYRIGPKRFRQDVRQSKALLEDISGREVAGYRAPSYSISLDTLWAFDELLEAGYQYDSSVFPVRHDLYGIPDWPRFPFAVSKEDGVWGPGPITSGRGRGEQMLEIPITALSILGRNVPIAGGGYFRLYPYAFTRWGLRSINRLQQRPFVFYLHPWELDHEQPRIGGAGMKSQFRHYLNLDKTEHRFCRLLADFDFATLRTVISTAELQGHRLQERAPEQVAAS